MDSSSGIIYAMNKAGCVGTDVGRCADVWLGAWKFYSY